LAKGYISKNEKDQVLDGIKSPKVRVNEQEVKEFEQFASNKKGLSILKKNKKTNTKESIKIGFANTYRAQFSNIDIRCNNDEIAKYPFDKN